MSVSKEMDASKEMDSSIQAHAGLEMVRIGAGDLHQYEQIPIAFEVGSILQVKPIEGGLGGLRLVEEAVIAPYWKDYDSIDGPTGPSSWAEQFDLSNWEIFLALDQGQAVGGAMLALDTPGVNMLEGRKDLAVLWDLRVRPERRGQGIGKQLFAHAVRLARQRGCKQLKIETQTANVNACRFYAAQGCTLGAIQRYAYASIPNVADEVMLLWYLDL